MEGKLSEEHVELVDKLYRKLKDPPIEPNLVSDYQLISGPLKRSFVKDLDGNRQEFNMNECLQRFYSASTFHHHYNHLDTFETAAAELEGSIQNWDPINEDEEEEDEEDEEDDEDFDLEEMGPKERLHKNVIQLGNHQIKGFFPFCEKYWRVRVQVLEREGERRTAAGFPAYTLRKDMDLHTAARIFLSKAELSAGKSVGT